LGQSKQAHSSLQEDFINLKESISSFSQHLSEENQGQLYQGLLQREAALSL
jgi:hypothetical protein